MDSATKNTLEAHWCVSLCPTCVADREGAGDSGAGRVLWRSMGVPKVGLNPDHLSTLEP